MLTRALPRTVLLGTENAGKSTLAGGLAGRAPVASNLAGSTIAAEAVRLEDRLLVDTPGLTGEADAVRLAAVLAEQGQADLLLVVAATRIDADLAVLLPLVGGRRVAVTVTCWDRVEPERGVQALAVLRDRLRVPVVAVDARCIGDAERRTMRAALQQARPLPDPTPHLRIGWRIEPPMSALDRPVAGPLLGVLGLLGGAAAAVAVGLVASELLESPIGAALDPLLQLAGDLPGVLAALLGGPYGLLSMGPLLLVWAGPVVLAFAVLGALGKASGVLDRLGEAVEPLVRWSGLTGRDLVRVVLGFGCNVPAVTATRSCAMCSRRAVVAAIAFGSACSYQLGATLGVFTAAGRPSLVIPYLGWLAVTALLHTRLVRGRATSALPVRANRTFVVAPRLSEVRREASVSLRAFVRTALPTFAAICAVVSVVAHLGALDVLTGVLAPTMSVLGLPAEAAPGVVAAAVRKDGILLLAEPDVLAAINAGQLLAATYLASVLTPCLVTALAIAREQSSRIALLLLAQQAIVALAATALLTRLVGMVAG